MPDQPITPARPWRIIATEITTEKDPRKMAALLLELNRALDEQEIKPRKQADPGSSAGHRPSSKEHKRGVA